MRVLKADFGWDSCRFDTDCSILFINNHRLQDIHFVPVWGPFRQMPTTSFNEAPIKCSFSTFFDISMSSLFWRSNGNFHTNGCFREFCKMKMAENKAIILIQTETALFDYKWVILNFINFALPSLNIISSTMLLRIYFVREGAKVLSKLDCFLAAFVAFVRCLHCSALYSAKI